MTQPPEKQVNPIFGLVVIITFLAMSGGAIWLYLTYNQPNPKQQAIATCTKDLAEAGKGSGIAYSKYEQECTLQCQRGQLTGCK